MSESSENRNPQFFLPSDFDSFGAPEGVAVFYFEDKMKEHPIYKGYFAHAEEGRVYTMNDRYGRRLTEPRPMNPEIMHQGHHRAHLSKDGKSYKVLVARFILETFEGPCPEGMESCHEDGDPSNNRWPDNIRWDTHINNMADQIRHGRSGKPKGEKSWSAKLNNMQARVAKRYCEMYRSRGEQKFIAGVFRVRNTTISMLCRGKNWKHLT